jgi:hypothetical protein
MLLKIDPERNPAGPTPIHTDFAKRQRNYPYGNDLPETTPTSPEQTNGGKPRVTKRQSAVSPKRRAELKNKLRELKAKGKHTKGFLRRARAAFIIYNLCWPIYVAQFLFALISLIGFADELGVLSISDAGVGAAAGILASAIIPGDEIAAAFWPIAAVLGLAQLGIGIMIFFLNAVNPFTNKSFMKLMSVSVGYFIPILSLAPLGIFWVQSVVKKKK